MVLDKAVSKISRSIKLAAGTRTPELLMSVGTGGIVATIVMAVQATPKANKCKENAISEARARYDSKLRRKVFVIAKVAPCYIPTTIMGVASLACFYKAHAVHVERQVALAGLYSMASQTLQQYQDKVVERLGEEAHENIIERILGETDLPEDVEEEAYTMTTSATGDNVLFYDRTTGRYFRTTKDQIREAESMVVKQTTDEGFCTLNYFYEYLGIEDNTFIGEAIGWDQERCRLDITMRPWKNDTGTELCWMLIYNTTIIDAHALKSR